MNSKWSEMMKIAMFSVQNFEQPFLEQANQAYHYDLTFFDTRLNLSTTALAQGFEVVCCFVTDTLNAEVLQILATGGTKFIALRCAGFNNIDLVAAQQLGITVARVPAYSPYAVAEFAVGLILALNRKLYRAYNRVREHNFSLQGLLGFDLHGKTVGVIGTGKIGTVFCGIMQGFGCRLIGYDPIENPECQKYGLTYVTLNDLYQQADVISLHCPLTANSHHLINDSAIALMKDHVMLINTGRGGLLDTKAIIKGLKSEKIGYLGIDVYEEEENLFFRDLSENIIQDDLFARLQTFPNVLITGHQAFFTQEALTHIAETTLLNIKQFSQGTLTTTQIKA